jgi:hypothetical protein
MNGKEQVGAGDEADQQSDARIISSEMGKWVGLKDGFCR